MSHLNVAVYGIVFMAAILWSVLEGDYMGNKKEWALAVVIVLMFTVFGLQDHACPVFIMKWTGGFMGLVLLVFAWDGEEDPLLWLISSSILFGLAILQAVQTFQSRENHETRAHIYVALTLTLYLLLQSLVYYNLTPPYATYSIALYFFPLAVAVDSWFIQWNFGKLYYLCGCLTVCIELELAARRWRGQTSLQWYLIIQPFLGLCFIQIIRYIRECQHPKHC